MDDDEASRGDGTGTVRYGRPSYSERVEDARVSEGAGDGHCEVRGAGASNRSLAAGGTASFSEKWDSGECGRGSGSGLYSVSMGTEPNHVQMELSGRLEEPAGARENGVSKVGFTQLARANWTSYARTYRRMCVV